VVVLSSGPGSVVRTVVEIDLPRPRERSVIHDARFGEYEATIRGVLEVYWSREREREAQP
jgi:hypothetical protein